MVTTFIQGKNKGKTTQQVLNEQAAKKTKNYSSDLGTRIYKSLISKQQAFANQNIPTAQRALIGQAAGPTSQLDPATMMKVYGSTTPPASTQLSTSAPQQPLLDRIKSGVGNFASSIPERISNVGQVLEASLNPLSQNSVEANFDIPLLTPITEIVANHPFNTALAIAGGITAVKSVLGKTAVSKAATVGKEVDLFGNAISNAGTAGTIATNTATTAKTASWFSKIAASATAPEFVIGTLMATIGSYPFAGFIKEEALQTIGFATKTAIDNGDIASAEEAIRFQEEILNPTIWDNIKAGVPFVNVLDKLDDFYEASRVKLAVDKKIIDDMKISQETGESAEERYQRVNEEQINQYQANIDYYNQERKKLLEWEMNAKANAREEEAAFWAAERAKKRKEEEEDRKAIADFWEDYKKRSQQLADDQRPSNLKFGLL